MVCQAIYIPRRPIRNNCVIDEIVVTTTQIIVADILRAVDSRRIAYYIIVRKRLRLLRNAITLKKRRNIPVRLSKILL
jgi:hypothetical protein